MIRISHILLFGASILAFQFLDAVRWAPVVEKIQEGNIVLLVSTILFLISIVFWAFSLNNFREITLPFKIAYSAWIAILLVIYIFGWSQQLYYFSLEESIYQFLENSFINGLFISLALLLFLEIGNKQAIKKNSV